MRLKTMTFGLADMLQSLRRRRKAARRRRLLAPRVSGSGADRRPRILALAAWVVPTITHKFVYQELAELARAGFVVRVVRGRPGPRSALSPDLESLASGFVDLDDDPDRGRRDLEHFRASRGPAWQELVGKLRNELGWSEKELLAHPQILRAFSIARLAEQWGADYLHSYFFYEGSLGAFVAQQLLGLPRGVSCYADHQLSDSPLKLVPLQLAHADIVVATSERIARELAVLAPECASRTLVKANAIDTSRLPFRERPAQAHGRPFRLVTVSRIDPKKALPVMAEALALLRDAGLSVSWDLVGDAAEGAAADAEEKEKLLERIEFHGLESVVRMRGWLPFPEVAQHLAAADLFVAPFVEMASGDKDGIPTALLEAMASGLPTVATDSGSIPEALNHGSEGLIVPQRDASALAAAIERLAGDPELRGEMGRAAAATARSRFDVSVCEPIFHERLRSLVRG